MVNEWGFIAIGMLRSSPPFTCGKADLTSSALWDQNNRVLLESVDMAKIGHNIKF